MTLVNISMCGGENLRTTECSLCGDEYGDDFKQFCNHLYKHHTFEDLDLTTRGEPPTIGRSPGGVSA